MNIFVIGNGFDLHNKLPTKYADFLSTVLFLCDNYTYTTNTVGHIFGNSILQNQSDAIRESYETYKSYYDKISLDKDKVQKIIDQSRSNLWFIYFSKLSNRNTTWIDFEKEIGEIINALNYSFNHAGESIRNIEEQKNQHLAKQFSFFLKDNALLYEGYFPDAHDFDDKYIEESPIGSGIYIINKKEIANDLSKMLDELADMLKNYLLMFVDSLSYKIKELGYYVMNRAYPKMHMVCSFNYTNTYKYLYDPDAAVSHIHGNIGERIVLGVNPDKNDNLNSIDVSFIQLKKYYQRVLYNTDLSYFDLIDELKYAFNSNGKDAVNLFVAGHSLDETDRDIIQELFMFSSTITIFYHKESAIKDYIKNIVSMYGKDGFDILRKDKCLRFVAYGERLLLNIKNKYHFKEQL